MCITYSKMKFCAFLFAAMMASASAFAPSSKVPTTTALNQAIDYNPNLGGATSSDPVDQTLMNMVRSSNDIGFIVGIDQFGTMAIPFHNVFASIFLTQSFLFFR